MFVVSDIVDLGGTCMVRTPTPNVNFGFKIMVVKVDIIYYVLEKPFIKVFIS